MSGPEHYRTAEILLSNLRREVGGNSGTPLHTTDQQARMIAEAQAHAILALAAATVTTRALGPPEPWGGQIIDVTDATWREDDE